MSLPSTGAGISTATTTTSIYVTPYTASQYAEFNRTPTFMDLINKKLSEWNTIGDLACEWILQLTFLERETQT